MRKFIFAAFTIVYVASSAAAGDNRTVTRSARSGLWSAAETWEGGVSPVAGARVLVRQGHAVTYDVNSPTVLRSLHIAGVVVFASDRDTRLDVGLIKIQRTEQIDESGADCLPHAKEPASGNKAPVVPGISALCLCCDEKPALLVGTPEQPIAKGHTALIRLHYQNGMDKESCPAIVCCGGRMEFHGAPMNRTWVKLGTAANAENAEITLAEPVTGWKAGDRVILTATTRQHKTSKTFRASVRDSSQTEERIIRSISGVKLTLDRPLSFDHVADGDYRGDVANLSRNVIIESAAPDTARGHTMYHRHSAGSISYAEFRHLGIPGVLGRYSLHYHLAGDSMRGSYLQGVSIWDSGNRWLTIHGTNYLVVRDCVGYQSEGHGFFLEDGSEVYNVLDRNLAVQAYTAKPLPKQILPFDKNDGSGFWWANCANTFTRNVACECDEYGYFFQASKTKDFDTLLSVQQPDGTFKSVDIRTLPFIRFEDNEAHCQRRHAFNMGGLPAFGDGVAGVGPDAAHPFVVRNFRAWNVHWAMHPISPALLIDGMDIYNADYGIWRPIYRQHSYRNIKISKVKDELRYAFVDGNRPPNADADYPGVLKVVDDMPPTTVITHIRKSDQGLLVRGVSSDNSVIKRVTVNGQEAQPLAGNFAEWEIALKVAADVQTIAAHAEDEAGNVEIRPHQITVRAR